MKTTKPKIKVSKITKRAFVARVKALFLADGLELRKGDDGGCADLDADFYTVTADHRRIFIDSYHSLESEARRWGVLKPHEVVS